MLLGWATKKNSYIFFDWWHNRNKPANPTCPEAKPSTSTITMSSETTGEAMKPSTPPSPTKWNMV